MTDQERIEEAHGLWELAVQRLAALIEAPTLKSADDVLGVDWTLLSEASRAERAAFKHWLEVSNSITRKA